MGQDAGGPSTDNTATAKEGDEEYRVYAARWLALAGLMLLMISSSSAWNTFSPVAARAAEFYGVGIQTVNWFALDMYLAFVVTGLLSAHIIDSLGLRVALITGASLTCAGLWLRYLGTLSSNRHTALAIAFAGQTLCGLGRPLGTASTTRLASTWFGIRERTYANAVASVSPSAGVLVASAVSPFLVATPDDIPRALLTWACISVFPLFVAVFVPGAPPTPPSPSAAVLVATRTQSLAKFKTSLHTAVTNPSFILLWVIMSLQLTIFFIYVVLISSIMSGAGYSPQQAGFVTVAIISAGWFSTPISKIVDRTGGWIPAMRSLLVLTTVAFAGLTLSVRYNVYWAIILCGAGFGFVSTPVLPVVFELGGYTEQSEGTRSSLLARPGT